MRKLIAAALVAAVMMTLVACGSGNGNSGSQNSSGANTNSSQNGNSSAASSGDDQDAVPGEQMYTGIGMVVKKDASAGSSGTLTITVASVLLDTQGVIRSVKVDVLEQPVKASDNGQLDLSQMVSSKREKGEDYGLKAASPIGKEWYQQADAFGAYCVGKTPAEVASIDPDVTDADLLSGCTIDITDFVAAVGKACADAKE